MMPVSSPTHIQTYIKYNCAHCNRQAYTYFAKVRKDLQTFTFCSKECYLNRAENLNKVQNDGNPT